MKNAFYAQSGGVTAVINASACGVIETARNYPNQIGKVYAGENGIIGALTENLIDTSLESETDIDESDLDINTKSSSTVNNLIITIVIAKIYFQKSIISYSTYSEKNVLKTTVASLNKCKKQHSCLLSLRLHKALVLKTSLKVQYRF